MTNTNYSTQVIHGEYYPHIDGIRAFAVLPVVLFHTLATLCPGGFAGVDVFFVISGYLITGGILRDLAQNRFTIRNFYHRRIRRIMPAYFALIAGVFVTGCAFYYATPLIFLGDSIVASTLFVSNFHFWMLGGDYFAPELHSQSLLHLWSLSVEEQFYLCIPLFCAIIWKFRRRLVAPALGVLAILSLGGSIYAVATGKQNGAFYFLHFRAWELLAGSLLAMLPTCSQNDHSLDSRTGASNASENTHTLFAISGLLLVVIPYVVLSPTTPFPGATALPSVIGTVLLIRYGYSGWVARMLAWRPFVLTGKVSYSLYLWHWPVIVFWKYAVFNQLHTYDYIGMFLLSLLLAYLSWKFVEIPVRASHGWTLRRSFVAVAAGMTLFIVLGSACVYYKGWPTFLHPRANQVAYASPPRDPFLFARMFAIMRQFGAITGHKFKYANEHYDRLAREMKSFHVDGENGSSGIGVAGSPTVFFVGDSHCGSLRYGLDVILKNKNISGWLMCQSSKDFFNEQLPEAQEALLKIAELKSVQCVVLAEMWWRSRYWKAPPKDNMYAELDAFITHLKSQGKTVCIVTDIPGYHGYMSDGPAIHNDATAAGVDDIAARVAIIRPRKIEIMLQGSEQSDAEYARQQGEINQRIHQVCVKTGATLIPLHLAFRQGNHYITREVDGSLPVMLYRDLDHLSATGSIRAANFILPYLVSK